MSAITELRELMLEPGDNSYSIAKIAEDKDPVVWDYISRRCLDLGVPKWFLDMHKDTRPDIVRWILRHEELDYSARFNFFKKIGEVFELKCSPHRGTPLYFFYTLKHPSRENYIISMRYVSSKFISPQIYSLPEDPHDKVPVRANYLVHRLNDPDLFNTYYMSGRLEGAHDTPMVKKHLRPILKDLGFGKKS